MDLPTPSGPITPTILRAGISIVTSSSAIVAPYRCETFVEPSDDGVGHCGQLNLKVVRPRRRGIRAHDPEPRTPVFTLRENCFQKFRVQPELDAKHQLFAFLGGLHGLRRELRVGRDKTHRGGNDVLRNRIQNDAGLAADLELAAVAAGRKIVM